MPKLLADALFNYADTGSRQGGTRYFSSPNISPGQQGINNDTPPRNVGLQNTPRDAAFTSFNERGSFDNGGGPGAAGPQGAGPGRGFSVGDVGLGASLAGALTGNSDMSSAGSALGSAAAATKGNYGPVGSMVGSALGGPMGGLAGGLAGLGMSDNTSGKDYGAFGLRGALGAISAPLGLAYSVANMATKGALNDGIFGTYGEISDDGKNITEPAPGIFGMWGDMGYDGLGGMNRGNMSMQGNDFDTTADRWGDMEAGPMSTTGISLADLNKNLGITATDVTPGDMGGGPAGDSVGSTGISSGARGGEDGSDRGGFNGSDSGDTGGSFGHGGETGNGGFGGGGGFSGNGGGGFSGGGRGGEGGNGGFKDGGMITPQRMSGLHRRYADGGQVGAPMLAQALYADGGQVGLGSGQPVDPQMADMKINDLLRRPGARDMITAKARQMMQAGSLTPEEVVKMGQIARACLQNPNLYPQLRKFAAAEGLGNLPPQYNPETIMKIMAVAKALGGVPGQQPMGQQPMNGQAQMAPGGPGGAYANGGVIVGPGTGRSDSVQTTNRATGEPVSVSNGEYIIPEHVVQAKGKDFFDSLLRKYSPVSGTRQGA